MIIRFGDRVRHGRGAIGYLEALREVPWGWDAIVMLEGGGVMRMCADTFLREWVAA